MAFPGHPNPTVYWLPTIPVTPIDIINRRAAATGSVSYARATGDANYNGHWVSVSFKDMAVSGPTWNAEYHWGERVVLARGSFERCIVAAKAEYDRAARGCSVRGYLSPKAPETLDEQAALAEKLGFALHSDAAEKAHDSQYRTGKHAAVSDALSYEAMPCSPFVGMVQHALEFDGTPEEWPAARQAWLDGRRGKAA